MDNFNQKVVFIVMIVLSFTLIFLGNNLVFAATPDGPSNSDLKSNETKATAGSYMMNISGGYIGAVNFTATMNNERWKGFVGWVKGTFALQDAGGSTLFDWTLSATTGQVYATRKSDTPSWTNLSCANVSKLNIEDEELDHDNNKQDNITKTFTAAAKDHDQFWAAGNNISLDSCYAIETYVNNVSQSGTDRFEEVALSDGHNESSGSLIYAVILEEAVQGYDGDNFDFQMIVPEDGSPGNTIVTAYYLYIELA
jgi:hypothetical protein